MRYHRQPRNLGAAANFNRCFQLAAGELFKWAADDDLLEPGFLAACVQALEANPDAVLAHSLVRVEDEAGRLIEIYDHSAWATGSARVSERLAGRLWGSCLEVFGVIRSDALRDSALIDSYVGSDRALLVDLALRGRFVLVPETLFISRDHPERCTRLARVLGDRTYISAWYDTQRDPRRVVCSTWRFYLACLRLVRCHVQTPSERLWCYRHLLASLRLRRTGVYLVLEALMVINPRVLMLAKAFGRALKRRRRRLPDPA